MNSKIEYLKRQLEKAISENDEDNIQNYYSKLLNFGVSKEELGYVENSLNKTQDAKYEVLKKLELELNNRIVTLKEKYDTQQKNGRKAFLFGILLMIFGIIMLMAGSSWDDGIYFALSLGPMCVGCVLFSVGLIVGFGIRYESKINQKKKEICEEYISQPCFDTYLLCIVSKFLETEIGNGVFLVGTMQKGVIRKGDTIYVDGELFEISGILNTQAKEINSASKGMTVSILIYGNCEVKDTYAIKI